MTITGLVSHDAQQLREELLRSPRPLVVTLDVETTGLDVRSDRILSVGVRFLDRSFILFTGRCCDRGILPHVSTDADIAAALDALNLLRTILVGWNIGYDLSMLRREGWTYSGVANDALLILRVLDQDRKHSDQTRGRRDISGNRSRIRLLGQEGGGFFSGELGVDRGVEEVEEAAALLGAGGDGGPHPFVIALPDGAASRRVGKTHHFFDSGWPRPGEILCTSFQQGGVHPPYGLLDFSKR